MKFKKIVMYGFALSCAMASLTGAENLITQPEQTTIVQQILTKLQQENRISPSLIQRLNEYCIQNNIDLSQLSAAEINQTIVMLMQTLPAQEKKGLSTGAKWAVGISSTLGITATILLLLFLGIGCKNYCGRLRKRKITNTHYRPV